MRKLCHSSLCQCKNCFQTAKLGHGDLLKGAQRSLEGSTWPETNKLLFLATPREEEKHIPPPVLPPPLSPEVVAPETVSAPYTTGRPIRWRHRISGKAELTAHAARPIQHGVVAFCLPKAAQREYPAGEHYDSELLHFKQSWANLHGHFCHLVQSCANLHGHFSHLVHFFNHFSVVCKFKGESPSLCFNCQYDNLVVDH